MRVAVLFVGRVKTFEHNYQSLQNNILEGHEYDSFLSHNASNVGDDIAHFCRVWNVKGMASFPSHSTLPFADVLVNPSWSTNLSNGVNFFFHKQNAYNIMDAYARQNAIIYDVVLYLRADTIISSKVTLSVKDNTVFIPKGYDFGDIHGGDGINDQMCWGDTTVMRKYCSTYQNILYYCHVEGVIFHQETLVLHNIRKHNLNVIRPEVDYYLDHRRGQ